MSSIVFLLIVLTVICNTAAQLALKIGMDRIGTFDFTWANFVPISLQVIISPWVILGIAIYVISVALWLLVLSRAPVGIAYPISSLGYIISPIAAYYLIGEDINLIRIAGIMIILIGVFLVARS